MKKKYLIAVAVILGLPGVILAYHIFFAQEENVSFLTQAAKVGTIEQKVNATGEISAVQQVDVGAQVSGQIKKLHVQVGREVKEGDLIAEIDSTTQQNDLDINKARLETYKAQLASRQINLKIAQTRYNREMRLKKQNAASAESLEETENTLAAAKAAVREAESLVQQTEISVSTAEVNLGYTRIVSPLTGTVVSVPVEAGQTVNANQTTPTICQIADLSKMEIKLQISEGDVTKVAPGMSVTYSILSEPELLFHTTLTSIDPGLTTLSDGTNKSASTASSSSTAAAVYYYGNLVVDNDTGKLRIGMTTQSSISVNKAENVLMVPTLALRAKDGKRVVQVLEASGGITTKEVAVGIADSMNTQILSGLSEGEEVVLSQMTEAEIKAGAESARVPRMRR